MRIRTGLYIMIVILLTRSVPVFSESPPIIILELNNKEEFVLIKNESDSTVVHLNGWILHDHDYGKANIYAYTFGDLVLQPGEILQMQSGTKSKTDDDDQQNKQLPNTQHYLRWSERNVWNDACDIAYLLDAQGNLVAEKHDGREIEENKRESCR